MADWERLRTHFGSNRRNRVKSHSNCANIKKAHSLRPIGSKAAPHPVVREVKEETGLNVKPEYIVGIYTNPGHVIAFSDGEIRQEFSLCFYCTVVGGEVQVSEESYEGGFFSPQEIEHLNIHPSIRLRLQHYLEHRPQPVIN